MCILSELITVIMLVTGFLQGFRKSGGFSYIPKDANELLIGFEFNDATSNAGSIVVPCRAMNKASPEIQPICVSAVDRQKPDRYIVHRFGKVFLETEYATASPETFDEDASWYGVQDEFFPGFSTWRPLSLPNHYTHGSSSNRQIVSELQNTTEFFNSASWHVFDRSKKGDAAYHFVVYSVRVRSSVNYTVSQKKRAKFNLL